MSNEAERASEVLAEAVRSLLDANSEDHSNPWFIALRAALNRASASSEKREAGRAVSAEDVTREVARLRAALERIATDDQARFGHVWDGSAWREVRQFARAALEPKP